MSELLIIDKMKKKAPILERVHIPTNMSKLEEQRFWEKQQKIFLEGYYDIPGSLYYSFNFCMIKHRVRGNFFMPKYVREPDLITHQFIEQQRKKHRHALIIKPRGIGMSTFFGHMGAYFQQIAPGTTCLATSKDTKAAGVIFKEKYMPVYDHLPEAIKPEKVNYNSTIAQSYIKTRTPVKNPNGGGLLYPESEFFVAETSENPKSPNAFSGKGAIACFFDEFPLHSRKAELLRSSRECVLDPDTQQITGIIVSSGTMELSPELTGDKLMEFKKFRDNCGSWGCDTLFLPYYLRMFTEENNGWCDKERAEKWWHEQYALHSANPDPFELTSFIRNNPRTEESLWETAGGERFEDDVIQLIKEQRKIVINEKPVWSPGRMVDMNQAVTFVPDKAGKIHKLEDPREGVSYYEVIDGILTGTESGNLKGSDVAGIVIKGFDPQGNSYAPVAYYTERPKNVEQSYINLTAMGKYYNRYEGFKGFMPEANAGSGDHYATFLKRAGLERFMLFERDLVGSGKLKKRRFGQYVTIEVRDWQMREANKFLRKHISSIKLLPLLDQMLEPKDTNTDLLDSFLMIFLALPINYDEPPRVKVKPIRQKMVWERDVNGALHRNWKDIP